jgi:hypothetical protein
MVGGSQRGHFIGGTKYNLDCSIIVEMKEWMDSAKLNLRNTYLDPNLIGEARHARPLLWQNDHPAFKGAKAGREWQLGRFHTGKQGMKLHYISGRRS